MEEFIKYLSEEYEFDQKWVTNYWNKIKNIPIVENSPEEIQQECLEIIVSDRLSDLLKYGHETLRVTGEKICFPGEKLEKNIYSAIYEVYGEESLNYIPESYQVSIVEEDEDEPRSVDEVYNGVKIIRILKK